MAPRRPGGDGAVGGPALRAGLALAAGVLLALPASAQVVRGRLLERGTERPITLALVVLVGSAGDSVARAVTDDLGRFTLAAPRPGGYAAHASALGYGPGRSGPLALEAGRDLPVDLHLEPDPLAIPGLEVARTRVVSEPSLVRNGFFERLSQGNGHFITPADLEASSASRLTDVLARVPFLKLVTAHPTDRILVQDGGTLCTPALIVDGLLASVIQGRRAPLNQISGSEGDIEALVNLKDVEAVEVYRGGQQMPPEFTAMSRSECGAIVIWTRRR